MYSIKIRYTVLLYHRVLSMYGLHLKDYVPGDMARWRTIVVEIIDVVNDQYILVEAIKPPLVHKWRNNRSAHPGRNEISVGESRPQRYQVRRSQLKPIKPATDDQTDLSMLPDDVLEWIEN